MAEVEWWVSLTEQDIITRITQEYSAPRKIFYYCGDVDLDLLRSRARVYFGPQTRLHWKFRYIVIVHSDGTVSGLLRRAHQQGYCAPFVHTGL